MNPPTDPPEPLDDSLLPDPGERSSVDPGIVIAIGDVAIGRSVYDALRALGQKVLLVSSALEALREIDTLQPAVLVVDDELPLVRGLDLAGRVRSERSDVEIILLTADEAIISVVGRLRVERLRCISKPFDLEKLRQAVGISQRALAQRGSPSAYDELVTLLQDQKASFEKRIEKLERRRRPSRNSAAPVPSDAPEPLTRGSLPEDLHILVVDDDPLVLRAMARVLSKQHVTFAENGLAATRELERSRPDVIVSDLRMPEMDGLALAQEVRRRWPELAERIVFVSGAGPQIERAELEAPSLPVLQKPVEGALLESRIIEILQKALLAQKS